LLGTTEEGVAFSFVDINVSRYCHDREPEECPICHRSVHAQERDWTIASLDDDLNAVLEIIYQCPRRECQHLFVARYARDDVPEQTQTGFPGLQYFRLYECVPTTPHVPTVPSEVADLSPSFVEIYSQAQAAEAYSLSQVAGVGYRKALEFLVKDYCISVRPSNEMAIRNAYLSVCINQYVDSPQVKLCAKRAVWLGNDETHYERRWNEMDVSNLKELIVLTLNWIHNAMLTRKYEDVMPE
jgi:hypothetical protein